ncbi:transporter [Streptomyces sp. NPDC057939]|uniref:transporter n=1 Tax=Streptomyces sp. NPDC057939 TaxID=3346284 RepID=UPI0036EBCEC7
MKGALWLAWRQQRLLILTATALLVGCAVWVAYQRSGMVQLIEEYGWVPCPGWNGGCESVATYEIMNGNVDGIRMLGTLGFSIPALIGVFWGAPLIGRELESGTFKVGLTQGVDPRGWFAARFGLAALFALLTSAVVGALVAWWWLPIANTLEGPYWHDAAVYNATGPAPLATALFALAAGTLAGLLVGKVLPAMGAAFGAIGAAMLAINFFRTSWIDPEVRITPGMTPKRLVGSAWSTGEFGYRTPDGREFSIGKWCQTSGEDARRCMEENGFTSRYHKVYPSGDFWTFQWIDTALYLGLAAVLVAVTLAVLRRRTA